MPDSLTPRLTIDSDIPTLAPGMDDELVTKFSLIDALYASYGIVFLGAIVAVAMLGANYLTVQDATVYKEAIAIVAVAVCRTGLLFSYHRKRHHMKSLSDAGRWESLYLVGAFLTLGGYGTIAATTIILHPDNILAFCLSAGAMAASLSVGTRNFASPRSVNVSVLACCLPLFWACLWTGLLTDNDGYLAVAIIPPFIGFMSVYLSRYLYRLNMRMINSARAARTSAKEADVNAYRFNVAINSMPSGLLLVAKDGRIIVRNQKAKDILITQGDADISLNSALSTVFKEDERNKLLNMVKDFGALAESKDYATILLRTDDRRWIEVELSALDSTKAFAFGSTSGNLAETHKGGVVIILQEVTEKVENTRALKEAAWFDKMTGLPNRQHWETLVEGMVASLQDTDLTFLAIVDVDRFKLINDTLGHNVGDQVIREIAKCLIELSDERLTMGRMGGDEFVIFGANVRDQRDVDELMNGILEKISRPYVISGNFIDVKCSAGVIARQKRDFNRRDDISRADAALYRTKKTPDRIWTTFDTLMEAEFQAARKIKLDLKEAIDSGSLYVVYQPICDLAGTKIVAFEALCRWQHEETGEISPTDFITLAEEIGAIGQLTEYVIRNACRDCSRWGGIPVTVNLSATDVVRDELIPIVKGALREFNLPASKLSVEVTEGVFLKDFHKASKTLNTLRSLGVKIALDDFGTGFSSLGYLKELPLDAIKIDQSFVENVEADVKARKLLKAITSLVKELDLDVIIEGVERKDQLEFVKGMGGVDFVQGNIYSPPMKANEIERAHSEGA